VSSRPSRISRTTRACKKVARDLDQANRKDDTTTSIRMDDSQEEMSKSSKSTVYPF